MTGPVSGVTGKRLEIELPVRPSDKFCPPGFEIAHYINDVMDPCARQVRIDQLATMLENILQMKLGAVIFAYSSREASACHGRGAAGGATLGHLDNGNASLGTFKRGHGAGCSAADDQHIGLMTVDGYLKAIEISATCHCFRIKTLRFRQMHSRRHRQTPCR